MTALKAAYTTRDVATLLNMTTKCALERAAREQWAPRPRRGRGGGSEWMVASMPDATRLALTAALLPATPQQCALPGLVSDAVPTLPPTAAMRAGARAAAVQLFTQWRAERAGADRTLAQEFARQWQRGDIPAPAWAREALPRFAPNSLCNWLAKIQTGGTAALAGNYGKRAGTGALDERGVHDLVQGILFETPHIKATHLREQLKTALERDGGKAARLPSLRRVQGWLREWKDSHRAYYQYLLNPDAYRSRYMLAMGSMSEFITRMNQRWEMDSTKVDLITSDGTRRNLTAAIDVFTRDATIHVSRTSSAHAVASTLRRGLVAWGKPESVGTDNGADYVAAHISRIMVDLTISQELCPPFQPWKKPFVEQFFHTFLHDLLELMPGYVGHNVAERQALRERESFAKRLMRGGKDATAVQVNMTPEELQAWIDQWLQRYRHRPHSGLDGRTPFEAVQEARKAQSIVDVADNPALRILLLPLAEGDAGWRTVGKKGIRAGLPGYYQAVEFAGMAGQRVQVRVDDTDLGTAYIFDEDGHFVCRALNTTVHGYSREVAVEAKRVQRQHLSSQRKAGASAARRHKVADLPMEVLMADVARAQTIEAAAAAQNAQAAPRARTTLTAPAIMEAHRAAQAAMPAPTLTDAEQAQLRAQATEALQEEWRAPATSMARFVMWQETMEALAKGEAVPARQRTWAGNYGLSHECAGHKAMAEMFPAQKARVNTA